MQKPPDEDAVLFLALFIIGLPITLFIINLIKGMIIARRERKEDAERQG